MAGPEPERRSLTPAPMSKKDAFPYIRAKVDQLLAVIGTQPLRAEELDDDTLIELDPIGIVADSFAQVIAHLNETNHRLNLATDEEAILVAARENATSTKNISDLQTILTDLMQNAKINESSRLAGHVQDDVVTTAGYAHAGTLQLGAQFRFLAIHVVADRTARQAAGTPEDQGAFLALG